MIIGSCNNPDNGSKPRHFSHWFRADSDNFVVLCEMLMDSLQHQLFRVNQSYNLFTFVDHDKKDVTGF